MASAGLQIGRINFESIQFDAVRQLLLLIGMVCARAGLVGARRQPALPALTVNRARVRHR